MTAMQWSVEDPPNTVRASAGRAVSRRGLVTAAAVLSGAALAACGPGGAPAQTRRPAELSGKVVFYTRGGEVETRGQAEILIPTFKKVAPNVEVVHEVFAAAAGENYTTKLYAMWTAGTPPDVWGFGQNYMAFWARGMLADLTPLITRDRYDLNQFHKGLPEIFRIKGKYYGIPQLTTFGTLLFYNKTLFQNEGIKFPPVDWDDKSWTFDAMLDVARKLTKNPGQDTAVYGLNYGPQAPTMHAWLFGGDAYLPEHWKEGIAPRTQLNSKESVAGHEFAQDVRWRHHVSPQLGKDSTTGISFNARRYAMEVNGGWLFWTATVIKDFKWGAAAIPWKATNKNVNYNDFWELSSQSKSKEAAWAFIKHIASADVQREYSRLTGTPPTHKAAMDVWYARYEGLMTRAELEKVTQGAIDPKRSQESADHLFVDWPRMSTHYSEQVNTPLLRKEGTAGEIIAKAKPGYDALAKEVYDAWKGKTPS